MGVYQKRNRVAKPSVSVALREQLTWLFPIIHMLEEALQTASETIDQLKQKLFELVLEASAEDIVGVKTPGAAKGLSSGTVINQV